MRFKVANYSRLEIRLDTLHIYTVVTRTPDYTTVHTRIAYRPTLHCDFCLQPFAFWHHINHHIISLLVFVRSAAVFPKQRTWPLPVCVCVCVCVCVKAICGVILPADSTPVPVRLVLEPLRAERDSADINTLKTVENIIYFLYAQYSAIFHRCAGLT